MDINIDINKLDFSKHSSLDAKVNDNHKNPPIGLIPAIVQHYKTLEILMLGYMSYESLQKTLKDKLVCFYSRSKSRLWLKGESSKNYLKLVDIVADCDNDSLVVIADPCGPTCHLNNVSCFIDSLKKTKKYSKKSCQTSNELEKFSILNDLQKLISHRFDQLKTTQINNQVDLADNSYTKKLLSQDQLRLVQKFAEEAMETTIAMSAQSDKRIISETSDMIYHLLCVLTKKNLNIYHVLDELEKRSKAKKK